MIRMELQRASEERTFRELLRRMGDVSPAWRSILADWKGQQRSVFATQGASIGAPWRPLSPRYAAWKAAHFGGPMLVRSGSLRAATEGRGAGFVERIAPLLLTFKITERTAHFQIALGRQITRFGEAEKRRWHLILQAYTDRIVAELR